MTIRQQFQRSPIDWMTPAERLDRIVELLALAVLRVAQNKSSSPPVTKPFELSTSTTSSDQCMRSRRGRIPFGQQQTPLGCVVNPAEDCWIKRIAYLSGKGLSSEKIAARLNQEDRRSKRAGKWSRTAVWRILQKFKKNLVTE